jgi:hypothetical protein
MIAIRLKHGVYYSFFQGKFEGCIITQLNMMHPEVCWLFYLFFKRDIWKEKPCRDFLKKICYRDYNWNMCGDLKVITILNGTVEEVD